MLVSIGIQRTTFAIVEGKWLLGRCLRLLLSGIRAGIREPRGMSHFRPVTFVPP